MEMIPDPCDGRRKVGKPLERSLRRLYGGKRCIVTDEDTRGQVHWHHLDEQCANTAPQNIVPLRADLNLALDSDRRTRADSLGVKLLSGHLEDRGAVLADGGEPFRAYGCSRLASFIEANHRENWDAAIHLSAKALLGVRPAVGCLPFAEDVLRRSVLPILARDDRRRQVNYRSLGLLAKEVSSYFRDYGDHIGAVRWICVAESLIDQLPDRDQEFQLLRTRLEQHRGISLLVCDLRRAHQLLETSRDIMRAKMNLIGLSNSALWLARSWYELAIREDRRKLEQAGGVLWHHEKEFVAPSETPLVIPEQVGTDLGGFTWWTYGEILLLKADIALAMGGRLRRKSAEDWTEEAVRFFMIAGLIPTAAASSPAAGRLREIARVRGTYDERLRSLIRRRWPSDLATFRPLADRVLSILNSEIRS